MSRSGSRYPSAFGHTPSYRSYVKTSDTPIGRSYETSYNLPYPSALAGTNYGSSSATSGLGLSSSSPSTHLGLYNDDLGLGGLGGITGSSSSSSSNVKQTTSSYSSNYDSNRGNKPVVEYSTDSTYKASTTGSSGVPHTSYAHSSSNYSSEDPYKNRVSNYSYNL